jgi:hypothetical protein
MNRCAALTISAKRCKLTTSGKYCRFHIRKQKKVSFSPETKFVGSTPEKPLIKKTHTKIEQEYKREAIELFSSMLRRIRDDLAKIVLTVKVESPEQVALAEQEAAASHLQNVSYVHDSLDDEPNRGQSLSQDLTSLDSQSTIRNLAPKVGRNDPCPCGSGKKYKQCHGKLS